MHSKQLSPQLQSLLLQVTLLLNTFYSRLFERLLCPLLPHVMAGSRGHLRLCFDSPQGLHTATDYPSSQHRDDHIAVSTPYALSCIAWKASMPVAQTSSEQRGARPHNINSMYKPGSSLLAPKLSFVVKPAKLRQTAFRSCWISGHAAGLTA